MHRRSIVSTVALVLIVTLLAGCAEMTEQQKGGAVGAGGGAILGALAGGMADKKNPGRGAAIGAAAGAALGGAAGWLVGEYRVQQVKSRDQAVAETRYNARQGVVATIDRSVATPQQVKPGDQMTLQVQYTVLAPPRGGEVRVRETRTILFANQVLTELPARELSLTQGTQGIEFPMTLPQNAADGEYTVLTTVEALAPTPSPKRQASSAFVVAGDGGGTSIATPASGGRAPATVTPVALPPQSGGQPARVAIGSFLFVKLSTANIREGAGTSFRILATASKGVRLQVLEEGGSGNDRWYRVKADGGQEGWVAGSAVTATP